ncbi:MAG: hypothetical protein KJZ47_15510, partial [Gemmatimonadales bacterium]|nr:hypothetical protein [Gemmatimonadales bacterium]
MMTTRTSGLLAIVLAIIFTAWPLSTPAGQYGLELARISVGSGNGTTAAASLDGTEFLYDDVAGT